MFQNFNEIRENRITSTIRSFYGNLVSINYLMMEKTKGGVSQDNSMFIAGFNNTSVIG